MEKTPNDKIGCDKCGEPVPSVVNCSGMYDYLCSDCINNFAKRNIVFAYTTPHQTVIDEYEAGRVL